MWGLSAEELIAIQLSLKVASVATLCSLPFGIGMALLLARGRFWGRTLVDGIVHLPLVLPPVVTGYLLLLAFGRKGPIGHFLEQTTGLVFAFRWTGAALASAIMGFPLLVRAVRLSFESLDPRIEKAAASLGASPAWVFATVEPTVARATGGRVWVSCIDAQESGSRVLTLTALPVQDWV